MGFEQHLFISDIHLGAFSEMDNQEIEEDLIILIKHCKKKHIKIHILGDLFDYWMEYPEKGFVPDLGKKVLDAFEDYNNTITPALYITGNHDNWTFGHFKQRGFDVESNLRIKEINGKQVLLMHGDGVATSKINFPRAPFHRFLRNERFIRIYQSILPPAWGLSTMKLFSTITRQRNSSNPQPLNRQAEKIFNQHNLDFIISGHDHIPRMETFSQGRYINLGTFYKHRTIALYNNTGLSLVTWRASSKNFIPFE